MKYRNAINQKEIGERLKRLRGSKSREEVAKGIGVSVSAIAMYENGERRPRDEIKVDIAKYYNVNVGDLFYASKSHVT